MLIKPAYAQAAGGEPSFLISLLPLVLIFVVFWFLLIRPQQKRMRAHREMIGALQKGDKVVTAGGIFGVVHKVVDDGTLEVEIAQGVRVRVARATISENVTETANVQLPKPANDASTGAGGGKKTAARKSGRRSDSTAKADDGKAAARGGAQASNGADPEPANQPSPPAEPKPADDTEPAPGKGPAT